MKNSEMHHWVWSVGAPCSWENKFVDLDQTNFFHPEFAFLRILYSLWTAKVVSLCTHGTTEADKAIRLWVVVHTALKCGLVL